MGELKAKLVAFYSRADENYFGGQFRTVEVGNTEKVAKMIAQMAGADLFKIEQKVPYAKDYKTCVEQSKADKSADARPELVGYPENMAGCDEVYLGFPCYCGTMPMAVFTFLEKYDWSGKTIHPFITHEGSGFSASLADIKKLCPEAEITEGLAVVGSHADEALSAVEKWVRG